MAENRKLTAINPKARSSANPAKQPALGIRQESVSERTLPATHVLEMSSKVSFPNARVRTLDPKPWTHLPWNLPGISLGNRSFPKGMPQDRSLAARMGVASVVAEPGEKPLPYMPANLPSP